MIVEEVDEFTTEVPVIDDGDTCGQIEHGATAKALANRTKHIRRRMEAVESVTRETAEDGSALAPVPLDFSAVPNTLAALSLPNEGKLGPNNAIGRMGRGLASWIRAVADGVVGARPGNTTQWFPLVQCFAPAALTAWDNVSDSGGLGVVALTQIGTATTPAYLALPLSGIAGYIKEVGISVRGGGGHVGLPATKPRFSLWRATVSAGVVTHSEVAGANDGSADVTAYEDVHTIPLLSLSLGIANVPQTLWTYLKLTGEAGANALAGEFRAGGIYVITNPNP